MVEGEKALVSPSSQDTNTIVGGCSGLNEQSPHRCRHLNTQTPGGGIVCRCFGGVSCWRKYVSGMDFESIQPHCTSVCSLCFLLVLEMWFPSFLLWLPCLPNMVASYSLYKFLLLVAFYQSNKKVANTGPQAHLTWLLPKGSSFKHNHIEY